MTTASQVALTDTMGLYGNNVDVARYSRKDTSSLIHGGDRNWGGLTVGLDSTYIL